LQEREEALKLLIIDSSAFVSSRRKMWACRCKWSFIQRGNGKL